eukprot:10768406-Lingulodinium_polyedra.AAC.1
MCPERAGAGVHLFCSCLAARVPACTGCHTSRDLATSGSLAFLPQVCWFEGRWPPRMLLGCRIAGAVIFSGSLLADLGR